MAACRTSARPSLFGPLGLRCPGQAITDSVLIVLGEGWHGIDHLRRRPLDRLAAGHHRRRSQPSSCAFRHARSGPDPASIGAAMIGGIAANNSSGMCCGTAQNSYKTLASMRVVLADGTVLDTGSGESRAAFRQPRLVLCSTVLRRSRARCEPMPGCGTHPPQVRDQEYDRLFAECA